jgi:hypothetical protein
MGIEERAFNRKGLSCILIPSTVEVLGPRRFELCYSLGSVEFESISRLMPIEESGFDGSGFHYVVIP